MAAKVAVKNSFDAKELILDPPIAGLIFTYARRLICSRTGGKQVGLTLRLYVAARRPADRSTRRTYALLERETQWYMNRL